MVSLEGLSVKVSAQTTRFMAGMSRVKDQTADVALSMRRMGAATSSAERDLDSAGRSATTTAVQMSGLTAATNSTNTSFMGLSATTIGALIPAIITLGAALTPVIAALTGFVAIAGAIGAVGLVSVIGGIATNTEMLKETFGTLIETIKTEFAPVFDLAAAVLDTLMWQLMQVIPALVPAQSVLEELAGNFAHLGGAIIDMLPAFVDLAVTLTEEFLPPFVTWVEDVLPQVPGMIESLVGHAREFLPMLMDMGRALGNLLPPLLEFGWTALRVIAPALGTLNSIFIDVLDFINSVGGGFDQLVAQASLIAPVLVPLVSFLGGPVTLALAAVGAAVFGLAKAFQNNFANIRGFLQGLWNEFQSILPAIRGAFNAFISGIDVGQITDAIGGLESALGAQLMATLEALRPVFNDFKTLLRDNKEEFRLIGGAVADLFSGLIRLGAALINILGPAFRTVVIPALGTFIDAADLVLTMIGDVIEATNELSQGNLEAAAQVGVESTAPSEFASLVAGPNRDVTQQELNQQIEVVVEGELPEESIRQVSVNEEQRRTRRRQGRQPNPN